MRKSFYTDSVFPSFAFNRHSGDSGEYAEEAFTILFDTSAGLQYIRVRATDLPQGSVSGNFKHSLKECLLESLINIKCIRLRETHEAIRALSHRNSGNLLTHDGLGCPQVCGFGDAGVSVSFSSCMNQLWAAIHWGSSSIGIDAACPSEFPHDYPLHRAFHEIELSELVDSYGISMRDAAAAVWSMKESVVKALGCGFRLIDPLDMVVTVSCSRTAGESLVSVSRINGRRFRAFFNHTAAVKTFITGTTFVSVAIIEK